MCGIVAVVDPTGRLSIDQLDLMRDRIAHRGPDAARSRIVRAGTSVVGLGHRRLSIIDLSEAASQPMDAGPDGPSIIFNGEIYNYLEIRDELEAQGISFRTRSDTEVLLRAWMLWGEGVLSRLNGMFAFAIWDPRRNELFLARDRFGEKPLFIAPLAEGGIVAASEMKAILAHPAVSAATNAETLRAYVAGTYWESGEATFFAGIRRVPAAHALIVDATGAVKRQWRWWTPDYSVRHALSDDETVARFRELMRRSVTMRLRADVPVGSSLSGGLDSSFIVGLLADLRRTGAVSSQHTFSARFDGDPTLSEGPYIDMVVRHSDARAFAVEPDPRQLAAESCALHWHQEEPFVSASIYLQWCVARLAREHGTTILLDGQGADELLGGYQGYFSLRQLDLLEQRRLARFARETMGFNRRLNVARRGFADSTRRFDHRVALRLRDGLRRLLKPAPLPPSMFATGTPPNARGGRFRRRLAEALQYDTLPALLRYADRNAMAFGREPRLPFLDYDLVDFVLGLPDDRLVAEGWQKVVLRRASAGLVPAAVAWRADKVGYAAPLDVWLRGPLHDWARDRLFSGPVTHVEGYDRATVEGQWESHQARRANLSWPLWRWISLSEWLSLGTRGAWKHGP